MRIAFLLTACLMLGACLDVRVALDFSGRDALAQTVEMRMERSLYDLIEADQNAMCADGVETIGVDEYRCEVVEETAYADLRDGVLPGGAESLFSPGGKTRLDWLRRNRVRVSIDPNELFASETANSPPKDMESMEGIIQAALAGHSFVLEVSGRRIVESTGDISETARGRGS
ncbi:hypothetical protein [Rhodovulum adriaticum]|uniref:Uncharacterized protein n=1 Tax=Rhodovulum adriaticum TaxID=35804 RepID=A0A4R2NZ77_RHOAD|nr:hypothetical protein [Rhodovulum adriaticum]MBK1634812.1 hypothetical protein [Rhodovulum adriaticum]TCP27613.1 hypothetical protein EV656_101522 [Rhodovulum adriaticum]